MHYLHFSFFHKYPILLFMGDDSLAPRIIITYKKSMECEPTVRASKILCTKRERVKRSRLIKKCKNATKFGNCPHFLTPFS